MPIKEARESKKMAKGRKKKSSSDCESATKTKSCQQLDEKENQRNGDVDTLNPSDNGVITPLATIVEDSCAQTKPDSDSARKEPEAQEKEIDVETVAITTVTANEEHETKTETTAIQTTTTTSSETTKTTTTTTTISASSIIVKKKKKPSGKTKSSSDIKRLDVEHDADEGETKPAKTTTGVDGSKRKKGVRARRRSLNCSSLNSSLMMSSNKKITDYFQIRKSSRKCKSDIDKEKRAAIEEAIVGMRESGLEVRHIENKGRGVFATKHFERGEFVCEYAGEMISYTAAKKREAIYAADEAIGCYMYFFEHKSKAYCIDATAESGRLGRLLNHSKLEGNCHTKLFEMNERPYLILVASRDIRPGEEMLYDYGDRNKVSLESHPWLAI